MNQPKNWSRNKAEQAKGDTEASQWLGQCLVCNCPGHVGFFTLAKPLCSSAVKRGLRPHQGTPAGFCCILGFGESREVLIPVLLNQMWKQEKVTATAPLQAQLETREDSFLEEKKSFVLHLYH